MGNDPGNCYGITDKTNLKRYYINSNMINVNQTERGCVNTRLMFDDGG